MYNNSSVHTIAAAVIPILLAITLHEAAHALVAYRCGDNTAKQLGRTSLNPAKHIDPIGTVLIPLILILSGAPFIFGWAKPVPVNYCNLNKPRRDMALVAFAGPLSNFIMMLLWAIIFFNTPLAVKPNGLLDFIQKMSTFGININIILMILNLVPIPPLDGSKIISGLLPAKYANQYNKLEPYGLLIIFALIFSGVLFHILNPIHYYILTHLGTLLS